MFSHVTIIVLLFSFTSAFAAGSYQPPKKRGKCERTLVSDTVQERVQDAAIQVSELIGELKLKSESSRLSADDIAFSARILGDLNALVLETRATFTVSAAQAENLLATLTQKVQRELPAVRLTLNGQRPQAPQANYSSPDPALGTQWPEHAPGQMTAPLIMQQQAVQQPLTQQPRRFMKREIFTREGLFGEMADWSALEIENYLHQPHTPLQPPPEDQAQQQQQQQRLLQQRHGPPAVSWPDGHNPHEWPPREKP